MADEALGSPGLAVRALRWTHRRLGEMLQLDPTQPSLIAQDAEAAARRQRGEPDDAE